MNINDFKGGNSERIHDAASRINSPHSKFGSRKLQGGDATNQTQPALDPEVARLVDQLAQSPEVRAEKILDVQQRIQSGTFFSRQATEATAEAFLR